MSWNQTADLRFVDREVLRPGYSVALTTRFLQQRYEWRQDLNVPPSYHLEYDRVPDEWRDVPLVPDTQEPPYIPTSGSGNNP